MGTLGQDALRYKEISENIYLRLFCKPAIAGHGTCPHRQAYHLSSHTILLQGISQEIARDISSRYGASFEITDRICRFMLTNHGTQYSNNSVARATGTAVETAEKYIGYMKESLLIHDLPIFSFKLKTQFKQNKKTYPADTGIRNAVCLRFSQDMGKLAETAVFHEINRRNQEVFYWKSTDGYEVDFVIKKGNRIAELYQVAWDVRDRDTQNREERALAYAMDELDVNEGVILTEDYETTPEKNGKVIKYIPMWKWLLI